MIVKFFLDKIALSVVVSWKIKAGELVLKLWPKSNAQGLDLLGRGTGGNGLRCYSSKEWCS